MAGVTPEPYRSPAEAVLAALFVDPRRGLSEEEARERRARFGPNRLKEAEPASPLRILLRQFYSLVVLLLAGASLLSLAFGEVNEALAILAVLVVNAGIGFATEIRAVRSMEALRRLGQVEATVRREGRLLRVSAEALVPGDIVVVEAGDVIPADLRLVSASRLEADESTLTGESVPVRKGTERLSRELPIADRANMLYRGTAATRGAGAGVVVATGMATELGRIAAVAQAARKEATPLERHLDRLAGRLVWATLAIAAVTVGIGILGGTPVFLMVETGIALAVAAIPEGLPIVATIALSRGLWRMARRNALINRLSAVETLGGTNLICADKTGTLTENRLTVARYLVDGMEIEVGEEEKDGRTVFRRDGDTVDPASPAGRLVRSALEVGALCNDAALSGGEGRGRKGVGDPLEVALLAAAARGGVDRDPLLARHPRLGEEAFDPDIRMMATVHRDGGGVLVAVKGAAESVIDACTRVETTEGRLALADGERSRWLFLNERLARDGYRVLALARRAAEEFPANPYADLTLVGLVGLIDPPRTDVRAAIERCHDAGIRVIMVTGDQPATARNIAAAVGLAPRQAPVYHGGEFREADTWSAEERAALERAVILARVSPAQKLDIIALHQSAGSVVAMTGDGVNDAPALRKADIGIAMGMRGTDVAREAADMVLADDAFASIVAAIEQGRVIFGNIRKFVFYLLSCNVAEILVIFLASLAGGPLPILPLQILFLNLVTDVFPALALGAGEGERDVMKRPPRDPREPILTFRHGWGIAGYGLAISLATLAAFAGATLAFGFDQRRAITVAFGTLALAQLWHVFNMRERGSPFLANEVTRNRFVWLALILCVALVALAVHLPGLSTVLKLTDPGLGGWGLILAASLVPLLVGQGLKRLSWHGGKTPARRRKTPG